MLAEVGDVDIIREFFCSENILSRSSFEIISFTESKELGRYATEKSHTESALSYFQSRKKQSFNVGDRSQYVPCQRCKKLFYAFKEKGTCNVKPYKYYLSCWRNQSKKVNAVRTQDDGSCFMQQDTQIVITR